MTNFRSVDCLAWIVPDALAHCKGEGSEVFRIIGWVNDSYVKLECLDGTEHGIEHATQLWQVTNRAP